MSTKDAKIDSTVIGRLKKLYWQRTNLWGLPFAYRRFMYRKFRRVGKVVKRRSVFYELHDQPDLVSEYIYVYGTCASYVIRLLQSDSPHFKTFIDVGANIGSVTIPVAQQFPGRVLSIEPSSANYSLLQKNIKLNKLSDRVVCLRTAIGDTPGRVALYQSPSNSGDHRLATSVEEQRNSEIVEVQTLDACVLSSGSDYRAPYLIKIDVQGYETKVLASATRLLEHPCVIVAELWPYGLRLSGSSVQELSAIAAHFNFQVYEVSEERVELLRGNLEAIAAPLSADCVDDTKDIVLTNMPMDETGLRTFIARR